MNTLRFDCTRCGQCCKASFPLGLAEALDYDDRFLLALVVSMETWDLGDFARNTPQVPITQDELLTTLAYRKDKLAMPASRDMAFQSGRVKATGGRLATFLWVSACALGDWHEGKVRCAALEPGGLCSIYETRPQVCRCFPLDPLYPEMLQHVPVSAVASRLPCDFSDAAQPLLQGGRLVRDEDRALLTARQEAIRQDSLFLPFYTLTAGKFAPMPTLGGIMSALKGNGRMDLPLVPALVYLIASGAVNAERAETCLERQIGLASRAVSDALARKDKSERPRTAVLKNCVALMEGFRGRLAVIAQEAEA